MLLLLPFFTCSKCVHDMINRQIKHKAVVRQRATGTTSSDVWEPMRVKFNFEDVFNEDPDACKFDGQDVTFDWMSNYKCTSQDIMTKEKITVLKKTLENIEVYLKSLLRVHPFSGDISAYLQNGPNNPGTEFRESKVDLHIIVACRSLDDDVIAFAIPQDYDNYGRPIAGMVAIDVKSIPASAQDIQSEDRTYFMTLLHETMHILGWSGDLFDSWRQNQIWMEYPNPRMISKYKYGQDDYEDQTTIRLLQTPEIVAELTRRFGTNTLGKNIPIGLEIEDRGGAGTAGSHMKMPYYMTDLMIAEDLPGRHVTNLTLAGLYDTTWYRPNFELSELAFYGEGVTTFPGDFPSKFPSEYLCQNNNNKCFADPRMSPVDSCRDVSKLQCTSGATSDDCNKAMKHGISRDGLWMDNYFTSYAPIVYPKSLCPKNHFCAEGSDPAHTGCYEMECKEGGDEENPTYHLEITIDGESAICQGGDKVNINGVELICPDHMKICRVFAEKERLKTGLSGGAIAGIVIGSVAGAGGLGVLIYFFWAKYLGGGGGLIP